MIDQIENISVQDFFHAYYFTATYIISTSPICFIFMLLVDIESSTFFLLVSFVNIGIWNIIQNVTSDSLKWVLMFISIFISLIGLKLMLNPFYQFGTMINNEMKILGRQIFLMRQVLSKGKKKEKKTEEIEQLCVVCLDEVSNVLLVHGDTAHKVICLNCSKQMNLNLSKCLVCGLKVTNVIRKIYT